MRFLMVVSGLLGLVALGAAQKLEIKSSPIRPVPAESGQAMLLEYCAVCHGKDAMGSGPALPALKVPPVDLTTLAKRNGGSGSLVGIRGVGAQSDGAAQTKGE